MKGLTKYEIGRIEVLKYTIKNHNTDRNEVDDRR